MEHIYKPRGYQPKDTKTPPPPPAGSGSNAIKNNFAFTPAELMAAAKQIKRECELMARCEGCNFADKITGNCPFWDATPPMVWKF